MLTGNDPLKKRPLPPDRRKKGGSFARAAGAFVPKIAGKAFEKFGFHTAEIMTQWPTIAGADIAAWTSPERIRWPRMPNGADAAGEATYRPGGTLVLRVEPARALDIEYRAGEIIDRINRYFGYRAVETIKLIQAPLLTAPSSSRSASRPEGEKGGGQPAPGAARAQLGDENLPPEVTALPEDGLKSALQELWASVTRKP